MIGHFTDRNTTRRLGFAGAQFTTVFRFAGLAILLSALLAMQLGAQSYQGAVRGQVVDTTGAAIPGVTVTLTDQATSVARATVSNESGLFTFSSVDPATYSISAESPGFKAYEQVGIAVETQQFVDAKIKLEIGEVTEVVTVTEQLPVIESATASGGTVLDNQKLSELPNSGRNPFMMSMLTPGVVPVGNPQFNRMQDQSGSSQISIAGGPVRGNNYYLDGVPITDAQNRAIIIPTIEAVMEVKVQSNTYDAEMGRTGGGTFNTTLKSGTNVLHGAGFGLIREGTLTANNFFNNRAGRERPDTPYRNYGGSLGGPIWIPGVYDGRNKTFWHYAAEGYDQKSSQVQAISVPSMTERLGDFSNSFNGDGSMRMIYDPLTTIGSGGDATRTAFANNVIPESRINPIGLAAVGYYATPNIPDAAYGANNFNSEEVISDRGRQMTFKADHEFFPKFRMNASYLHYVSREPGPPHGGVASYNGWVLDRKVDATQVNALLTPDATTVVSVRWGFNRFPNDSTTIARLAGLSASGLGFPADFVSKRQIDTIPDINHTDFVGVGRSAGSDVDFYSQNLLTSVSKFSGKHSMKFGLDYRRIHQDFTNFGAGSVGVFDFTEKFTRANPLVDENTGSSIADGLLGFAESGNVQLTTPSAVFVDYYGGYMQDDIRISSALTLNLGLRVEYETGLKEKDNNFSVDFDRSALNPISNSLMTVPGGLIFAGVNGAPTEQGDTGIRLGPRFGLAYKLNEKTVLRGGVGFFWAPLRMEGDANGIGAVGYTQTTPYVGTVDGAFTPSRSISDPYPDGFLLPTGNSLGLLTGVGSTIGFANPNRRGGLVKQFSLDIQRELPFDINLTLAYIGSRSSRLNFGSIGSGAYNINALSPGLFSQGLDTLTEAVANPFAGEAFAAGVIGGSSVSANQLMRPFPQFNTVSMYYGDDASASYDSLVVRVQKRMSKGLTLLSSITWAKAYDYSWANGNTFSDRTANAQNPYDLEAERSQSLTISPWRNVNTFSYELPIGVGKSIDVSKFMDYLVGGWQLNMVNTIQSGFPMAIYQSNNNSTFGYQAQRPSATGVSPEVNLPIGQKIDNWINPDAFSRSNALEFGNLGRTIGYRGPGIFQVDFSVFKDFTVMRDSHPVTAQFRAEFINFTNTPQFRAVNSNLSSGSFGTISQQGNFPRVVQLGLRFIW